MTEKDIEVTTITNDDDINIFARRVVGNLVEMVRYPSYGTQAIQPIEKFTSALLHMSEPEVICYTCFPNSAALRIDLPEVPDSIVSAEVAELYAGVVGILTVLDKKINVPLQELRDALSAYRVMVDLGFVIGKPSITREKFIEEILNRYQTHEGIKSFIGLFNKPTPKSLNNRWVTHNLSHLNSN